MQGKGNGAGGLFLAFFAPVDNPAPIWYTIISTYTAIFGSDKKE
jgi:hypothetical protein